MIKFCKLKDPHGHMSNFYPCSITLEHYGSFPTSEHLYQSMKYTHNQERFLEIQNSKSAWAAAKMGRDKSFPMRNDWEEVKDNVMRFTVMQKYYQNPNLASLLLDTGEEIIVEHAPHGDYYWGDGGDGTGKNMLGIILQEVRYVLREEDNLEYTRDLAIKTYLHYAAISANIKF